METSITFFFKVLYDSLCTHLCTIVWKYSCPQSIFCKKLRSWHLADMRDVNREGSDSPSPSLHPFDSFASFSS